MSSRTSPAKESLALGSRITAYCTSSEDREPEKGRNGHMIAGSDAGEDVGRLAFPESVRFTSGRPSRLTHPYCAKIFKQHKQNWLNCQNLKLLMDNIISMLSFCFGRDSCRKSLLRTSARDRRFR